MKKLITVFAITSTLFFASVSTANADTQSDYQAAKATYKAAIISYKSAVTNAHTTIENARTTFKSAREAATTK